MDNASLYLNTSILYGFFSAKELWQTLQATQKVAMENFKKQQRLKKNKTVKKGDKTAKTEGV